MQQNDRPVQRKWWCTPAMKSGSAFVTLALTACAAPQQPAAPVAAPAPAVTAPADSAAIWYRGAWKREWFADENGAPSETSIVHDLQTPTLFGSIRIPLDRPAFPGAKSFDDLDDAQLAMLLHQRGGFAGLASFDGDVAVWDHEIDFQPVHGVDTARLKRTSPTAVLEEGLRGEFKELWWSMASGDGKYLGIKVANDHRTERILVVVGDHFVHARNRKRDLPVAKSMSAIVKTMGATRAQIIEMLDCELSYGTIRSGRVPWEIRFSTLPWLEGKPLELASAIALDAAGQPAPRTPTPGWSVVVNTFERADLEVLFPR